MSRLTCVTAKPRNALTGILKAHASVNWQNTSCANCCDAKVLDQFCDPLVGVRNDPNGGCMLLAIPFLPLIKSSPERLSTATKIDELT